MSTTFSVTRDQLITEALEKLGVLAEGQTANATQLAKGSNGLNILFKLWANKGWKAWLYRTVTFPFQAAVSAYTMGPTGTVVTDRPIRVAQAWWQDANNFRTPMNSMTREEFLRLTPVNAPGLPNSWYYQPTIAASGPATMAGSNGTFNVWQVPTDTNGTFGTSVQRPIEDLLTGANQADLPQTTFAAVVYGLADWLLTDYGVTERTAQRIEKRAAQLVAEAFDFEEEDGPLYIQPASRQGGR